MTVLPPDAEAIRFGKKLPKVYISGPYTKPDPESNLVTTALVCSNLAEEGVCLPWPALLFCEAWEARVNQTYEFWIEYTKHMLVGCDLLFRIPGESDGADGEVDLARELGIPVLIADENDGAGSREELIAWCEAWQADQ